MKCPLLIAPGIRRAPVPPVCCQGIEEEELGRLVRRPRDFHRNSELARQQQWAMQTDSKVLEYVDSVAVTGSKVISGAGKEGTSGGRSRRLHVFTTSRPEKSVCLP
jgi:hypothetical protein